MKRRATKTKWTIGPYVIRLQKSLCFERLPRYSLGILIDKSLVNIGWYTSYERAIHAMAIHADWYFDKRNNQQSTNKEGINT